MGVRKHHALMWDYSKGLMLGLGRPVFLYLITASFSLMAFFSVGFYAAERGVNPEISSLLDSLYYVVTVMSGVGLGDIVPKTGLGRVLSMVMMLVGTGLFVSFTAVLSTLLWEIETGRRKET